jgi:hypothetical protein
MEAIMGMKSTHLLCPHCAVAVSYDEYPVDPIQDLATTIGLQTIQKHGYLAFAKEIDTFLQCEVCNLNDATYFYTLWEKVA